jgi:hypothetical protein
MQALVVFESMFGNTEAIARAVGSGLATKLETGVHEVGVAPRVLVESTKLLVVGGPTHAFGMSRAGTRESAAREAGGRLVSQGIGVREWLDAFQLPRAGVAGAAFDTRIDRPRFPGAAANAIARRLGRAGVAPVISAESFYVSATEGPLLEGELERARQWGESLAASLVKPPLGQALGVVFDSSEGLPTAAF